LLKEYGIKFEYREYTKNPLSVAEIKKVLKKLGKKPHEVLRKTDKAAKDLGVTGEESANEIIELMAQHPTLLQRPIGVAGRKAELGRPIENLLRLT
jgi:arsenate reductase